MNSSPETPVSSNPYRAPEARVETTEDVVFAEVPLFGFQGRIGRSRYFGYSLLSTLALIVPVMVLAGLMGAIGGGIFAGVVGVLLVVLYIAMLVYHVSLAIRRAHDFNGSGWLSILLFVPLANLVFLFMPGTAGENRFGLKPKPGKLWWVLVGLLFPAIIGILAAIAIPAYQDYVTRARAAQHATQAEPN